MRTISHLKTINVIVATILLIIPLLGGEAESIEHVQFKDAGLKYDHIWISLRNYRVGKAVNRVVKYAIYTDKPEPIIGPSFVEDMHKQLFPSIEFQIDLDVFGISYLDSIPRNEGLSFVLFISDGNTPRDGYFLKQVLKFDIRKDIKSAASIPFAPLPLEKIPIYYDFDKRIVFPIIEPDWRGYLFIILDFHSIGHSDTVLARLKCIDNEIRESWDPERRFYIQEILSSVIADTTKNEMDIIETILELESDCR